MSVGFQDCCHSDRAPQALTTYFLSPLDFYLNDRMNFKSFNNNYYYNLNIEK